MPTIAFRKALVGSAGYDTGGRGGPRYFSAPARLLTGMKSFFATS